MVNLFGIPNCDTIKKARKWLEQNNIDYQFHDFKQSGPSSKQLNSWIKELGWEVLLNKRSTSWRNLSDKDRDSLNQANAIKIMLAQPTIIKRPVLDLDGNYYVGFSDKSYRDIFKDQ
ncbi:MAG: ArsC family reductase [Gammaproteobacteria bacterium]|nr:ArsC family reductase [Gammaproteobacteria bacterium]